MEKMLNITVPLIRTIKLILLNILFFPLILIRFFLRERTGAMLFRLYLQSCGGAWIKFGQILSSRLDLISNTYYEELQKLTSDLPTSKFEKIRHEIESSLGKPLDQCYSAFDPKPVASASIAQVHFANLPDGQPVAVKVMHPNATRVFLLDLFWINAFSRFLDLLGIIKNLDLPGVAAELAYVTKRELDLSKEAINTQRFHEVLTSDSIDHTAPRVFFSHCSKKVITMQRFDGVWLGEMVTAVINKDAEKLKAWEDHGIYPHRTARVIFRSLAEQICHHRIIHGDPHVGNIVVLDGGTVGFIDFGIVGELDEKSWRKQIAVFYSMSQHNVNQTYQALLSMIEPLPYRNLAPVEMEVKRLLSDWFLSLKNPNAGSEEKSNGRVLLSCANVFRQNNLQLPFTFFIVIRTTLISDMLIYSLYPQFDPTKELAQLFRDEQNRKCQEFDLTFIQQAQTIGRVATQLPEALMTLTSWISYELPIYARLYTRSITGIEKFFINMINLVRISGWLLVLAISFAKLFSRPLKHLLTTDHLIAWMATVGPGTVILILVATILLSRLIKT
jgi:ubiquinone biosynthesis protein